MFLKSIKPEHFFSTEWFFFEFLDFLSRNMNRINKILPIQFCQWKSEVIKNTSIKPIFFFIYRNRWKHVATAAVLRLQPSPPVSRLLASDCMKHYLKPICLLLLHAAQFSWIFLEIGKDESLNFGANIFAWFYLAK